MRYLETFLAKKRSPAADRTDSYAPGSQVSVVSVPHKRIFEKQPIPISSLTARKSADEQLTELTPPEKLVDPALGGTSADDIDFELLAAELLKISDLALMQTRILESLHVYRAAGNTSDDFNAKLAAAQDALSPQFDDRPSLLARRGSITVWARDLHACTNPVSIMALLAEMGVQQRKYWDVDDLAYFQEKIHGAFDSWADRIACASPATIANVAKAFELLPWRFAQRCVFDRAYLCRLNELTEVGIDQDLGN